MNIEILYGYVELETRTEWEPDVGYGAGRKRTYNREGEMIEDTGWVRNGSKILLNGVRKEDLL